MKKLRYNVRCGLCISTIGRVFLVRHADRVFDRHLDDCPGFHAEVKDLEWLP